jgi:hypothetical protein
VFKIAIVLKMILSWNFCVAKRQTWYGKTGHHIKTCVENNTNLCYRNKRDFEHKSFVCLVYQILDLGPCVKLFPRKAHRRRLVGSKNSSRHRSFNLSFHVILNQIRHFDFSTHNPNVRSLFSLSFISIFEMNIFYQLCEHLLPSSQLNYRLVQTF